MRAFAALIERLAFTPSRTAKLRILTEYLGATPDPDRGYALAALTGDLAFASVKAGHIRGALEARLDPELFRWSYDYVGDLAETAALAWPAAGGPRAAPRLSEAVASLQSIPRGRAEARIAEWLDALDVEERYALLKLVTGALRVGVSARLARQALAGIGAAGPADIEEVWHAIRPPYLELFAWLEGRGERPRVTAGGFRPVMLAQPLDAETDLARLDPADFFAEWKWDGVRVQAVCEAGERRLYTRTGDDISAAFPEVVSALGFDGVLDGELLVLRNGAAGSFGELQTRLNRKTAPARLIAAAPTGMRCYDLLFDAGEDIRAEPLTERRRRLERLITGLGADNIDLSPLIAFEDWAEIADVRAAPPEGEPRRAEGIMLKRRDSPYVSGRPKGPWFKWKRDPLVADAVLMYAQRGHGRRSSFYSDFTFGVWSGESLVPVGKAYFGFTDAELQALDRFVRTHTIERFGPVRSVRADQEFGLVLEVAFEGLQRSSRHRSGLAMRFPRISRIRWDKPAREADRLESLETLLDTLNGTKPGANPPRSV